MKSSLSRSLNLRPPCCEATIGTGATSVQSEPLRNMHLNAAEKQHK